MSERMRAALRRIKIAAWTAADWFQPHRRAALLALVKASLLLGTLSELGWQLNEHYFSRFFPQFPISIAWSMLSMIFFTTWAQVSWSIALKLRSERGRRLSAAAQQRLTALLAEHISGENLRDEIKKASKESPGDFEACVVAALLGLRGAALRRLCELPEVAKLRTKWITRSRAGDEEQRRRAVEQMALLRDPAVIAALEAALRDPVAGVVAAAVRGLLRMPFYNKREQLIRSLGSRPFLVRVLTAREAAEENAVAPAIFEAEGESESADVERARCSALAALGSTGHDLLRLMAALGEAGDAPAEALGQSLAAAARGGTT